MITPVEKCSSVVVVIAGSSERGRERQARERERERESLHADEKGRDRPQ